MNDEEEVKVNEETLEKLKHEKIAHQMARTFVALFNISVPMLAGKFFGVNFELFMFALILAIQSIKFVDAVDTIDKYEMLFDEIFEKAKFVEMDDDNDL